MLFSRINKYVFVSASFIAASFLLSFIGIMFNPSTASAHTLTITTNSSINLDVIPNGNGASIKTESINVASTCRSGYNLSISTPEGSDLYKYDSTNDTFDSTASFTAVDGTSALSSSSNTNKWGYTLTSDASTSTVFSPLSATATVLKTYSQTASPSSDIDDTFNINYGVKVDSTITPGNYQMANHGAIVYYATVEPTCLNYTVQYQDGGADNPNGMGTTDASTGEKSVKQINISEGTTITLLPPNFKKQGHSFLGWSTDQDAYTHFTDNDNTNDPVIYGPMETVTIDSDIIATANIRNQINMYPVWLPALRTDPSDSTSTPVYFQDWDNPNTTLPHDGCSTLTQTIFDDTETNEKDKIKVTKDSVVALTDKRDNEVYTVARLADGKCWMTENLRLDAEYTMGQNQNDSNVTNQYLSQGYGGTTGTYGNFVGLADSENANFHDFATSNTAYKISANPPVDTYDPINNTLEDIGTTNAPNRRIPRYNSINTVNSIISPSYIENYTNASSPSLSGTYKNSAIFSYGNYYNWAAVMANTDYFASSSISEIAGTSICPSGWTLPTSGSTSKGFSIISQRYGGTGDYESGTAGTSISKRLRSFPNSFLYSGDYDRSSATQRGSGGYYWSTSASYGNNSYSLNLYSASLYPSYNNSKFWGFSVRCVVEDPSIEITLDSNNNANAISRVYGSAGETISLPQSSIAESGYGFKNWNTALDGSGTTYTNSFTIPAGSTGETLYAQWTPQYTIVYVNNCMSYANGNASCTQTASDGTSVQKLNLDASGDGSGTLKASNFWTTMSGWKIAGWNTSADGTGTEYRVNSTYAVTGQSAGDGIALYAHWVPTYSIQYDGNGADNPDGMGTTDADTGVKSVKQTNVAEGDSIILLPPNFKRENYGFVGWSTDANAWSHFTDNDNTNDPTIYGPMETITAPAYPNNGTTIIILYAVWVEAEKDNNDDPVYLQDFGTTECSNLTSASFNSTTGEITAGDVIALTDKRDNEVYAIAKLADNNCWMIENMRLESAGTLGNNINDSTVTNQSLAQGYGSNPGQYGSFVGLAGPETTNFTETRTSNSIYESTSNPPTNTYDPLNSSLEDIGSANRPGYRFPRYNSSNTKSLVDGTTYTQNYINTYSPSDSGTNYRVNSNVHSYGNYYTWPAAVASTAKYTTQNSDAINISICPSNWRLPDGGTKTKIESTSSDIWELIMETYNHVLPANYNNKSQPNYIGSEASSLSQRLRAFPYNYVYSGYYVNTAPSYRGSQGLYWSSTVYNETTSLDLYLDNSQVNPGTCNGNKPYGRTIRCVISGS